MEFIPNGSLLAVGLPLLRRWTQLLASAFLLIALMSQGAHAQAESFGPPPLDELVSSVKHSVVNLSTTRVIETAGLLGPHSQLRQYFGEEFLEQFAGELPKELRTHSLGSGVLIDKQGHILTNNHVIENATEIKVKLQDQKEYDAQVVGTDPKTELALIKVMGDVELPEPVQLGDSNAMDVGDWVIAMGNPFGLGHTVTQGIISAKSRSFNVGPYDDFLQTDAAINPGNSGGPLFNMKGEVIGINTAIMAEGQGIGFAIPINMAKEILPQLKQGKVVRGWLGIVIQDVTPENVEFFGLAEPMGVIVSQVIPGSPADSAGLKQGDALLNLDGQQIEDANTFSRRVAELKPGQEINLNVVRNGKQLAKTVVIGEMPEETEEKPQTPAREEQGRWGFSVQNISEQLAQALALSPDETGVIITSVQPGSAADDAGLQPGDLVKELNRQPVRNLSDFKRLIRERTTEGILLLIRRAEQFFFVPVRPRGENG